MMNRSQTVVWEICLGSASSHLRLLILRQRTDEPFKGAPPETPPKVIASPSSPKQSTFPDLGDGWTNVEWTILEHTHDHIRNLGNEEPEKLDPTELAQEFLKIYEKSEFRKKAEEEGKEHKVFSVEEVRDRIVALRDIRKRRKSGELPPAPKLHSPASIKSQTSLRRLSAFFNFTRFWQREAESGENPS
jgi:hypothetical protein